MHYVYLLLLRDGEIYTGLTNDLRDRFWDHAQGMVRSTKFRRPVSLVYYEAYAGKADAVARERFLKTGDGRRQVRKQLQHSIPEASRTHIRPPSSSPAKDTRFSA